MQEVLDSIQAKIHSPMGIQYAFIAASGLALFAHVAFLVPAFYFLAKARLNLEAGQVEGWLKRHFRLVLWSPALLVVLLFVTTRPAPLDDLLVISSIASGGFSHDGFAFSDWGSQPASPWHGFEVLLSLAIPFLGQDLAMQATQTLSVLLTSTSITLAVHSRMRERTDLVLQAVILIGLAMASMAIGRAYSGRVESFFFAWAIAAFWMPAALWFAIGVVMSPLYWLAWIYAPAALLLKAPLLHRLIIAVALLAVTVVVWTQISDGHYVDMFALTSKWLSERQGTIGENIPLLSGIGTSPTALFLMISAGLLAVAGKGHRKEWPLAMVAIWFALPDMLRYLPLIATIIAVWIMGVRARDNAQIPAVVLLLAALLPLGIGFSHSLPSGSLDSLPKFSIPADSVVLGPLNHGVYATIRHNPGIKPTPAFEIGSTDIEIQAAAQDLQSKGEFDCSLLRFYQIDYIVDNRLTHIPSCLRLEQVQGSWRLWKTIKPREI